MTQHEILQIKNSWCYITLSSADVGVIFYHRLFEMAPHLRSLFDDDMIGQVMKFEKMITHIVNSLDEFEDLFEEIKHLAQRHIKYGALPVDYETIYECLIWALSEKLNAKWSKDIENAWRNLLGILSQTMIINQMETLTDSKDRKS